MALEDLIGKKCKACNKRVKKSRPMAKIILNTLDGEHEMQVCQECSDFWDKSADVIQKRGFRGENQDESV